jgi:hypothetical protein
VPVNDGVRLADLLAGLSLVSGLGLGLPPEDAMRSCLVGAALARRINLDESEVTDVFYTSLLQHPRFDDERLRRRPSLEAEEPHVGVRSSPARMAPCSSWRLGKTGSSRGLRSSLSLLHGGAIDPHEHGCPIPSREACACKMRWSGEHDSRDPTSWCLEA